MNHAYDPHPVTGGCMGCPARGHTGCLWCGHPAFAHDGVVDPAVLAHYAIPGPEGRKVTSRVRWTPRACGEAHCACRTYVVRGR